MKIVYPEGGYEYPKYVEDKDTTFYCYPLKDIQSTRDSFESAYDYNFLKLFDEYNLSFKPKGVTTFRLIYGSSMGASSVIILTPDQIIAKTQIKGWSYAWHDSTKLAEHERFDFDILQRFYPLNDTSYKERRKHYFDSLTKENPKLLDPNYYKSLLDKSANWGEEKFEYELKRIPITRKTFYHLVNQISESGYWQLPFENKCQDIPTDAAGFILEANNINKGIKRTRD